MTTVSDRRARVRACACALQAKDPRGLRDGTTTHRDRGWPRGGPGCRAAHRLNPASRMWTRREWGRYRRTGRLPAWDYTNRHGRRRTRRGR
jgi:hypothetical protein